MSLSLAARWCGTLAALSCLATAAGAQDRVSAQPQLEGRLEMPTSPAAGAMLGAGLNARAGWYVRVGAGATAGALRGRDGWVAHQRIEATARFLLDPFGEHRSAWYGGAGLGLSRVGDARPAGDLVILIGLEGRTEGRVVPAVELMLGRGLRAALVLRGRRPTGR